MTAGLGVTVQLKTILDVASVAFRPTSGNDRAMSHRNSINIFHTCETSYFIKIQVIGPSDPVQKSHIAQTGPRSKTQGLSGSIKAFDNRNMKQCSIYNSTHNVCVTPTLSLGLVEQCITMLNSHLGNLG